MSEAKRMGLDVLLPDVNESFNKFTVNDKGQIRFGMGGIKNVGASAVADIVKERQKNGKFKSFFDFIERVNLSSVNKRTIEALVYAGAFDELENLSRSQYFAESGSEGLNFIEECLKYGGKLKNGSDENQASIFSSDKIEIKKPTVPEAEEWNKLDRLKFEKEAIGIYLSEHPLDEYELEISTYCNADIANLANLQNLQGKEIKIAAIIKDLFQGTTKNGKPYGSITLEGYKAEHRIYLFGHDYVNFRKFFIKDTSVLIKGKVQKRWNAKDDSDIEFKITEIELLTEIKSKMIKALTITVPVENISDDFSENLLKILEAEKGKQTIEFKIFDKEKNMSLNLFSRTKHIKINKKLLDKLKVFPEIELSLS